MQLNYEEIVSVNCGARFLCWKPKHYTSNCHSQKVSCYESNT